MAGDEHDHHHDHDHAHPHDRAHDHRQEQDGEENVPDMSAWIASAPTTTCPACGASGAVTLGGGVFCPACGEVSTSPGFQSAPEPAES